MAIIEISQFSQIDTTLADIDRIATERIKSGSKLVIELHDNKYSKKQRGALHVWCDQMAKTMSDHGMMCVINHPFNGSTYEIPWTGLLFKEHIYKFILNAMTGKQSTEDQSSVDPSDVAMVIIKRFADNGLNCPPWPSLR